LPSHICQLRAAMGHPGLGLGVKFSWKRGKPAPGWVERAFGGAARGSCRVQNYAGDHLISHTLSRAVPSAQRGLTSVFGMGTGGTLAVRSPAKSKALKDPSCGALRISAAGADAGNTPQLERRLAGVFSRADRPNSYFRDGTEGWRHSLADRETSSRTRKRKSIGLLADQQQGSLRVFCEFCAELILWISRTGD
jgi:hypothetical protein